MSGFVAKVLCPTLIGREPELTALAKSLELTRSGEGRTVLVSGEAGIGKSAVLRAFATSARITGADCLVGECIEIEARQPFGPFVQMLDAVERERPAELERSLHGGARELVRLMPTRTARQPRSEPTHGSERYRIHESFVRLFTDLARIRTLVLTVDDLQWADEATLELFPYLATRLRSERVLIVGSYRSDEMHRLHPLNEALRQIDRIRTAERIALRPLDVRETSVVIRDALGLSTLPERDLVTAVCAPMWRSCGGAAVVRWRQRRNR